MSTYAYYYNDGSRESLAFKSRYSEILAPENIFYDSQPADVERPGLDALIATLNVNDVLHIPSLCSLGSSMDELLVTLESLRIAKTQLHILCEKDNKLLSSTGSVKNLFDMIISMQNLQTRIAKVKQINGIKKALLSDSMLCSEDVKLRKYKGRKSRSDEEKLKVAGCILRGESPTEIANKLQISRSSTYNYTSSMSEKYKNEIDEYRAIIQHPNFINMHEICGESIAILILDVVIFSKNLSHNDVTNYIRSNDFIDKIIPIIESSKSKHNSNLISDIMEFSDYPFNTAQIDLAGKLSDVFLKYKINDIYDLKHELSSAGKNLMEAIAKSSPKFDEIQRRIFTLVDLKQEKLSDYVSNKINSINNGKSKDPSKLNSLKVFECLFNALNSEKWKLTYFYYC